MNKTSSGICAIVKATYLRELSNRSDFTWETYPLFVWSSAELFVLIVCGSIPSLKPLWDRYIIRKTYISSSAERSGTDGPSTWSSASGKKKGSMWGPVMSPQRTNYGEMEVEDIEMQGSSDKRLEETSWIALLNKVSRTFGRKHPGPNKVGESGARLRHRWMRLC